MPEKAQTHNTDIKSVISNVKVPTTTLRGGQLILSADLARVNTIKVNGTIIHGENPAKVHPQLANIYKAIAVALTISPRSDRGGTLMKFLVENAEALKPVDDRVVEVELPGVRVVATIKDAIEYARAAEKVRVEFQGTPLRTRKEKTLNEEEYVFV